MPILIDGEPINYSTFPVPHMRQSIMLWIEHGMCTGSFLTAFLRNDLKEAVNCADADNAANLSDSLKWFYNNAPSACYGSPEKFDEWQHKMRNL